MQRARFIVRVVVLLNKAEEQRLRDADYNLREAYAIYLGLCEYAYGGRPTQTTPTITQHGDTLRISTVLDDGLDKKWWGHERDRTLSSTISIYLDDERLPITYDRASKTVTADTAPNTLASQGDGTHVIQVHHTNKFKHHNYPQRYRIQPDPNAHGDYSVIPLGPTRAEAQE